MIGSLHTCLPSTSLNQGEELFEKGAETGGILLAFDQTGDGLEM